MFSNSTKYAIKALIYIVCNSSEEHKLLVRDIAKSTEIPKPYLSKIIQQLSMKNYLSSTKGRNGGVFLTSQQLKTSILDIIIVTEGKDIFGRCALNFKNCDFQNPCPVHEYITISKESIRQNLRVVTLEDFKHKKFDISSTFSN